MSWNIAIKLQAHSPPDTTSPGLSHCEQFQYVNNAIAREKELKHWTRAQKIALIEAANPTWEDLMPDEVETIQAPSAADSRNESALC